MEIVVIPDQNKGAVKAYDQDQNEMGRATYFYDTEDVIILDHVIVDPAFEGQGIGRMLVREVADFARRNGLKVRPWCSFAKIVFTRDQSLHDVMV